MVTNGQEPYLSGMSSNGSRAAEAPAGGRPAPVPNCFSVRRLVDPMSGRLRLPSSGSERISAGDEAATGASGTLSLRPQGKAGAR